MELSLKFVFSECEVHAVICFLMAENLSESAIHKWLQHMYDVKVKPEPTICLRVHGFGERWENIHNDDRCD